MLRRLLRETAKRRLPLYFVPRLKQLETLDIHL
jgi:hypothetical protein